jgi:CMP-N,N'-diacetyllegionaminic acid synthase
MIAWSIDAARRSRYLDRTVISSDDPKIISIAQECSGDVPFRRAEALATDNARIEDVLVDALDRLSETFDYIVLLQPTSPLREAEDIDACIQLCCERGAPACVSVTPVTKSPYWMFLQDAAGRLEPLMGSTGAHRRQELPQTLVLNGAVYVADVGWFRQERTFLTSETLGHVMPGERSVDIDSELDLRFAATLLEAKA